MDNKGGIGGNPTGANESQKAPEQVAPMGEIPNFDEFLKSQESPNAAGEAEDLLEKELEPAVDETPVEMPPLMPEIEAEEAKRAETPALTDLKKINVPRDAEELPKDYVASVSKILDADKDDPYQLVEDWGEAKWDMMGKAFGRNLGDGLNGGGEK